MFEIYRIGRLASTAAVVGVMLLIAACVSSPMAPPASLNEAKLAIETAERVDASHYANAELDEAREKLLSAERAVAAENMVLADRYAQQSIVTAELATAKTETDKALAVNAELNRGVKALIEEMQRTGDEK